MPRPSTVRNDFRASSNLADTALLLANARHEADLIIGQKNHPRIISASQLQIGGKRTLELPPDYACAITQAINQRNRHTMEGSGEQALVRQCLEGNPDTLEVVQGRFHPVLHSILRARGATATEAEDLLADLWGDCVPRGDECASLLEKYHGRCALQAWLATVATHRWVDWKRRQAKCAGSLNDTVAPDNFHKQPLAVTVQPLTESALSSLLRSALKDAFAACAAETLLMLRLVHLHGLTQREVGRMWGWHEAKVSRSLQSTMDTVRERTLAGLHKADPVLHLEWDDLLEVCAHTEESLLPA